MFSRPLSRAFTKGYGSDKRTMKSMNIQKATMVLIEVKELLDELDIVFFLRHGTCLGAVRDGGLIPWDDDLDIGSIIGMNGLTERSVYETADILRRAGFEATLLRTDFYIAVELTKSGIPVDWTCYRVIEGNIIQYPAVKIPAQLYCDLKTIRFLGGEFSVPNPPEKYLQLKYGSEWQLPKETGFEKDIINSIPESVIPKRSGALSGVFKFLFPNKYTTRIRVLDHDREPVELAEVTVVGFNHQPTDHRGYARFDLPNEDYYALVISRFGEEEILYAEFLRPGKSYCYVPSANEKSGRTHVMEEEN